MTKRKDTKAKAFTCRGVAALITASLLTAALLLTGCPQSIENKPNIPSGPDPNLRIEGGVLKGYNETPSGTLVIPAGVTEIASNAFSGCTSLTQVNFPASLTKIGSYAFSGCTGLTSLNLPANLETLDYSAFRDCSEIAGTVVMPANLKTIDGCAFYGCNKVDAFDFTQCTQLTSIGGSAFASCKADAVFTVKKGGNIKNYLLNSQSGIKASQITEVP